MKIAHTSMRTMAGALTLTLGLWTGVLQAAPLIIGNGAASGGGPIATYNYTPTSGTFVTSFVLDGALPVSSQNNGRGLAVAGNEVYYTELSNGFGPTDFIHVAQYNGGAGSTDIRLLPNPTPATGVQDLAFHNGVLYALTGYLNGPQLEVFKLDPTTGAVLGGPIVITGGAAPDSNGFTVLPNGNFLINNQDFDPLYLEFNGTTGAATGVSFTVPGADLSSGVDIDPSGTSLYFATLDTNLNSFFTHTGLAGNLLDRTAVGSLDNFIEDIALVQNTAAQNAPVPEPGTLLLLSSGLFGLLGYCRRFRQHAGHAE